MRSVLSSSSSTIVSTPKHHHFPPLLFTPKLHTFLSPYTLLSLSLFKPTFTTNATSFPTPLHPSNTHNDADKLTGLAETASKLVESGRFDELRVLVEEVGGLGGLLDSKVLVGGIVKGIREGRVKSVVGFFRCFRDLGVDVLRVFDDGDALRLLERECCNLVYKGRLDDAVEIMEMLQGLRFSIKDLIKPSDMIRMFVNRRRPSLAVRYACLLPHAEVIFCTIIREFGKRADLQSAVEVFECSKQKLTGHNMYVYRTMIDICGVCGNCLKSRLIYEDLINQKVKPNIFVFNSLMNVNSHDLTYTMEVYKQMQDFAIEADMTSYNILLKACCLSGRVDLAQDIYTEVQRLESTGALKLDVFTYSTIIKVFADAKLWQMAIKIKEDMLSAGVTPNTVTWSSLISACANAGLVDQASQLFDEMLLSGCEPNPHCFNTLLHACVEACQYDRAFRLFNAWKSYGSSMKTNQNSTHHLSFAKSTPFKPTTATYNILLKACGTDFFRAKGLIDEMKALNLSPDNISWSILIDISGAAGNVQGALQILTTMSETGMKPDVIAYTTAIKVCVESKNLKMAFSLFAEMKRCRIKPNLVTYNTLLQARSKYGSLQEIQLRLAVYQDMRRAGYKSNDYYLKLLIEEWCEGVLQNKHQGSDFKLRDRADIGGLRSLLLDRVATHLQKSTAESLAVDIQGLTKVEARLVVLAALRLIRENYASGRPLKDNLEVILGIPELDADGTIKDAITKLLKKELGLEVLPIAPSITISPKMKQGTDSASESVIGNSELHTSLDAPTRRPAMLQRLVVTKKSLNLWLARKLNTASRR